LVASALRFVVTAVDPFIVDNCKRVVKAFCGLYVLLPAYCLKSGTMGRARHARCQSEHRGTGYEMHRREGSRARSCHGFLALIDGALGAFNGYLAPSRRQLRLPEPAAVSLVKLECSGAASEVFRQVA
jgi:hypothetical protein